MLKTLTVKDFIIAALLCAMLWLQFRTNSSIVLSQKNYDDEKRELSEKLDSLKYQMSLNEKLIEKSIETTDKSIQKTTNLHKLLQNEKQDLQKANDSINIAWFHAYIEQYRLESGK